MMMLLKDTAYTMWAMPDGSTRTMQVSEWKYKLFTIINTHKLLNKLISYIPGRPTNTAKFLMAAGGCDRNNVKWEYSFAQASEPINGFSIVTKHIYTRKGIKRLKYFISNHKSVTFDASSSGSIGNANSLTISHTVTAAQSNLYIAGMVIVHTNTLTSSSYNAVAMTTRDSNTATNFHPYLTDLVNPATGTHNGVFTPNTKSDLAGGFVSAYGVHQTTPRRATANSNGTSTTPSLTITSATGDLAISTIGYDGSAATDTPDAFWVTMWTLTGAGNNNTIGQRISGASPTQVRNDSLSASIAWAMVGASIQPVATTSSPIRLPLMGVS